MLSNLFGKSRQAFHKRRKRQIEKIFEEDLVIQLVKRKRKNKPRTGTRKLLTELQSDFENHKLKIGRDALFDILRENKMLIKKRKTRVRTTNSYHWLRKYPNLIKNFEALSPNKL